MNSTVLPADCFSHFYFFVNRILKLQFNFSCMSLHMQVMASVLGPSAKISRAMLISMRGITKIFVGQLVETGTALKYEYVDVH